MMRPLLLLIVLGLSPGPARAEDGGDRYRVEVEPQRIALVLGNSDYPGLGPVPSAARDAEKVRARLVELGFTVLPARDNVKTRREFEDFVLPPLGQALQPGALVVVYYSGHGFTYGQHNFLAMTDLPRSIREDQISKLAVSVESLETWLASREPGMQVFLVDACRNIAGFAISERTTEQQLTKGFATGTESIGSVSVNTLTGYAAKLGTSAISSGGALSPFTNSLVRYLGIDERSFESEFNDVVADVLDDTDDAQWPGMADWSSSELFLKPSPALVTEERQAWEAALASESRSAIGRFHRRHSISRHAAAARLWLAEHPVDEAASYTALSPVAVERAWTSSETGVAIKRADTGFAFARNLWENVARTARLSAAELGIIAPGSREPASAASELSRELDLLQVHEDVISTHAFEARVAPAASAQLTDTIEAGTNLKLLDFTRSEDGSIWARATMPSSTAEIFLPVSRPRTMPSVQLGRPLKEVVVPPLANGIDDLVQPETVLSTLAALRAEGKTVTWVSVAASESADSEVNDARQARMVHAQFLLKRYGVDGKRITAVLGQDEHLGEGVRLRFFGY